MGWGWRGGRWPAGGTEGWVCGSSRRWRIMTPLVSCMLHLPPTNPTRCVFGTHWAGGTPHSILWCTNLVLLLGDDLESPKIRKCSFPPARPDRQNRGAPPHRRTIQVNRCNGGLPLPTLPRFLGLSASARPTVPGCNCGIGCRTTRSLHLGAGSLSRAGILRGF